MMKQRFWTKLLCLLAYLFQPTTAMSFSVYRSGNSPVKWSTPSIPWFYNHHSFQQIPEVQVIDAAKKAFSMWEQISCSYLSFNYKGKTTDLWDSHDGKNTILWNTSIPDPQHSIALALTIPLYDGNGKLLDVDIVLNSSYKWSLQPAKGEYDLLGILVHEVGHFLGLDHTSEKKTAMYPWASSGLCPCRSLSVDDINGICSLYPNPDVPRTQALGQTCDTTKHCSQGFLCTSQIPGGKSGYCLQECSKTCQSNEICQSNPGGQKLCMCFTDTECKNNRQCINFRCTKLAPVEKRSRGDTCDDSSPCKEGFSCIEVQQGEEKRCVQTCHASTCSEGEPCVQQHGAKLCLCQQQDDCPSGSECVAGLCEKDSRFTFDGKLNEPCDEFSQCQKGLVCAPNSSNQTTCQYTFSFPSEEQQSTDASTDDSIPKENPNILDKSKEIMKDSKHPNDGCTCLAGAEPPIQLIYWILLPLFFLPRKKRNIKSGETDENLPR